MSERARLLIDQCFAWCMATGNRPQGSTGAENWALTMLAVEDTSFGFRDLNRIQRQAIAGLALKRERA